MRGLLELAALPRMSAASASGSACEAESQVERVPAARCWLLPQRIDGEAAQLIRRGVEVVGLGEDFGPFENGLRQERMIGIFLGEQAFVAGPRRGERLFASPPLGEQACQTLLTQAELD